jgi:hypothetical protein
LGSEQVNKLDEIDDLVRKYNYKFNKNAPIVEMSPD